MGTENTKELAKKIKANYELYNLLGRGKIEEWNWNFVLMRGDLGKWIAKNYTTVELKQIIRMLDNNG